MNEYSPTEQKITDTNAPPTLHDAIANPDLPGAVAVLRAAVAAKREEMHDRCAWNRRYRVRMGEA